MGYIRDQTSTVRDSPNLRYSPLTGRRVSGAAQATSSESHTETVQIESSVVGLVIGRQGENMRRLEAETRTRIQFAPASESSGPMRKCTITGSKAAIEHAINEIDRTIEENDKGPKGGSGRAPPPPGRNLSVEPPPNGASKSAPRKDEATLIIEVPSRTVGLIIGKRGESIKDLQDRSHCHVNIMPEEATVNGMRPVHLLGTPHQAAVANAMIMEIVNTDSKKLPDQGAGARDGVNSMALGARTNNNEKITDGIVVPSEAVGMIIGKGGETIRDMQDATGCKINVSQPSGRDIEREIELIGSRSAIQEAKAGIMEKVRAVVGVIWNLNSRAILTFSSKRRITALVAVLSNVTTLHTLRMPGTKQRQHQRRPNLNRCLSRLRNPLEATRPMPPTEATRTMSPSGTPTPKASQLSRVCLDLMLTPVDCFTCDAASSFYCS